MEDEIRKDEHLEGDGEGNHKYLASVYAACSAISSAEIIAALEKALQFCPEKRNDILRIAKGLPNLAERSSGKEYIKELEKRARKK